MDTKFRLIHEESHNGFDWFFTCIPAHHTDRKSREKIRSENGIMVQAFEWCTEQFGEDGPSWRILTAYGFSFNNEVNALAFRLRWC